MKRKADTTTPGATIHTSSSPYNTPFDSSPVLNTNQLPSPGLVKLDPSIKPAKKLKKDGFVDKPAGSLDIRPVSSDGEKLSPSLEFCREILKELFGKRHAVCNILSLLLYFARYVLFILQPNAEY